MYKLVVCGFDGTLLDDDQAISISTVLTIDEVRRNSKFIVATGRTINFVTDYIKDVNFLDYIIALNGSYIYDVSRDKCIFDQEIKIPKIKKIINTLKETETKIYLCTDHSRCLLNTKKEETEEIVVRNLNDFLKNNKVYKIEIHTKTNKLRKEILKIIKELELQVTISTQEYDKKDYFLEITSEGVSKYTAVRKIAKDEKIAEEEILAFGNNQNDLELLKKVGYGISMRNGTKEVQKAAQEITLSNNEKGVEKSLHAIFHLK